MPAAKLVGPTCSPSSGTKCTPKGHWQGRSTAERARRGRHGRRRRLHPPNPRPRRRRLPHLGGGRRLQSGPGSGPGLVGGRRGVEHGLGLEPSRSHGGNRAAAGTSGYDASVDYVVVEHLSVDVADGVASLVVAAVIGLTRLHGVRPLTRCAAHRRSGGRWTGCRSDGSGAAVRSRPHVGLRGGRVVVQIDRPTHEARMSPLGPPGMAGRFGLRWNCHQRSVV